MTPALTELMEKLAEQCKDAYFNGDGFYGQSSVQGPDYSFKAGWRAAIEHVSKDCEFDEMAAFKPMFERGYDSEKEMAPRLFIEGAKWQFEQMSARVGLLQKIADSQIAYATKLECEIKASKTLNALLGDNGQIIELEDKLAQALQEIERLKK